MRIGLVYIKGSVPGFESFGNIPTDIVKSNGLVNGVKAHKALDGLIIPGGSILESGSLSQSLATEIKKIAIDGKPVVGVCSGFQALSNITDVGRKSPCPIERKGIGILDVNFSPMISNDRIKAYTKNDSFLTKSIANDVYGFHCHTYGNIESNETPILYSNLKRINYSDKSDKLLSGVKNDDGNVIGTMIHGIFDENPAIVDNFFEFIGANENDIDEIYNKNKDLIKVINSEIAIDDGIHLDVNGEVAIDYKNRFSKPFSSIVDKIRLKNENKAPLTLMIGSTDSDSGKTFITTGLSGNLRKLGLKVAILKIGPDIRDTVPSLYLTKGRMEKFSSIKIGHLGWMDIANVLKSLKNSDYDFVLIEGAMSVFIGLLKEITPYSAVEIAISSDIPMLMVSSVSKNGIESAAINSIAHINTLKSMGVNVKGLILNKVYDLAIFDKVSPFIKNKTDVNDVIAIPKVNLDERGSIPEVELDLEDFSSAAMDSVGNYVDLERIIDMSNNPEFKGYLGYEKIKEFLELKGI